mmetsp:Transcript_25272/g.84389  ORF Transcript_25272/g.84389 Transcript_25272/m.84389 type:complete len:325 (+) Transcript_25272:416-1390(+)
MVLYLPGMHVEHRIERDQRQPVVEQCQALLPQLIEVDMVQGNVLHELLQIVAAPSNQELTVWNAHAVEALRAEDRRSTGLIPVATLVGDRAAAWMGRVLIRADRRSAESPRFDSDIPAARLSATTEVHVGELLLQAVVSLDAALRRVLADTRFHTIAVVVMHRRARGPLFRVRLLHQLGVLYVPVVFTNFSHQLCPLVVSIFVDIQVECNPGTCAFHGGSKTCTKLEVFVLSLRRPVVISLQTFARCIIVVCLFVHQPIFLCVRLQVFVVNHFLAVLRSTAWASKALRQHFQGVASVLRLSKGLAPHGLVDLLVAAVLVLRNAE